MISRRLWPAFVADVRRISGAVVL